MTCVAAVLKLSPGEKDAVACKAVILIELSRFEEAVEHIDEHAANFKELSFEKVGAMTTPIQCISLHHVAEAKVLRRLHVLACMALHIAGVMGADMMLCRRTACSASRSLRKPSQQYSSNQRTGR